METEEKDLINNNAIQEEVAEKEQENAESEYADMSQEEQELRNKLAESLERERYLTLIYQQKEKQVKNLGKKYDTLKNQIWEQNKQERAEKTTIKLDSTLLREITTLKDKIQDRAHRIELLEKELDSHKSQSEMYQSRFKNMEEFQTSQKLSHENSHLENYLRSEYYKSSLDKIQALKQLAEQLGFEVERATVIKAELEEDKSRYDAHLKQVRSEFKKLQDENERLAEEADKRKNSM